MILCLPQALLMWSNPDPGWLYSSKQSVYTHHTSATELFVKILNFQNWHFLEMYPDIIAIIEFYQIVFLFELNQWVYN